MSFIDTVVVEKPAIVIDIGHAYTKCGFAGENGPHSIISSKLIRDTLTNKSVKIYDYKSLLNNDEDTLKELLIEFLYRIYYKVLNANARERKVV